MVGLIHHSQEHPLWSNNKRQPGVQVILQPEERAQFLEPVLETLDRQIAILEHVDGVLEWVLVE